MLRFDIFKGFLLSLFAVSLMVACNEVESGVDIIPEAEYVDFSLDIDNLSLETVDIRVRHDGDDDLKWVYLNTTDLDSDPDELIDAHILKEYEFTDKVFAYTGNNRSLRISGLAPKTDYRIIIKSVSDSGSPIGKAQSLLFRTRRNLDVFEENFNWNVTYGERTEGYIPGANELIEFDNFNCTSSDDEPYILAVIKKSDYQYLEKDPDHKLKLRTFFEKYVKESGISGAGWSEVIESGDCTWQEQRLRHGDWLLFMVGVDEAGELTGLYRQFECNIPEETPTEEFNKWLGLWEVTGYNQGVEYKFNLSIISSEANLWYYSIGWEPENVYQFDPASLPVEIFFDKPTGNAYLVSQYVSTATDMTGYSVDFYFYGTFPYMGSSTYVPYENIRLAEITMTNEENTEAKVTGLNFTTTQAGTTLSLQFTEAIYFMVSSGGSGTAISMAHPDFPFKMKKIAEL